MLQLPSLLCPAPPFAVSHRSLLSSVQAGYPVLSLAVQYRAPARFGDVLEISVRVKKKGRTSLTYAFTVERDGTLLATAEVGAVCCKHDSQGNIVSIPIPAGLADQIIEAQVE